MGAVPPVTTTPVPDAPLSAPLPKATVPALATPLRKTLFVPPLEEIDVNEPFTVPVVRLSACVEALMLVSLTVSVPKLDPVSAVPATVPSATPRSVLLLPSTRSRTVGAEPVERSVSTASWFTDVALELSVRVNAALAPLAVHGLRGEERSARARAAPAHEDSIAR